LYVNKNTPKQKTKNKIKKI